MNGPFGRNINDILELWGDRCQTVIYALELLLILAACRFMFRFTKKFLRDRYIIFIAMYIYALSMVSILAVWITYQIGYNLLATWPNLSLDRTRAFISFLGNPIYAKYHGIAWLTMTAYWLLVSATTRTSSHKARIIA